MLDKPPGNLSVEQQGTKWQIKQTNGRVQTTRWHWSLPRKVKSRLENTGTGQDKGTSWEESQCNVRRTGTRHKQPCSQWWPIHSAAHPKAQARQQGGQRFSSKCKWGVSRESKSSPDRRTSADWKPHVQQTAHSTSPLVGWPAVVGL